MFVVAVAVERMQINDDGCRCCCCCMAMTTTTTMAELLYLLLLLPLLSSGCRILPIKLDVATVVIVVVAVVVVAVGLRSLKYCTCLKLGIPYDGDRVQYCTCSGGFKMNEVIMPRQAFVVVVANVFDEAKIK